jgi:Viral BACON domain
MRILGFRHPLVTTLIWAALSMLPLCAATLGTPAITVDSGSGNTAVMLAATGSWTAQSNSFWLHVANGSVSGGANALIQFSYDRNPDASARAGTLTIAGLTLTVTQLASGYVPATSIRTVETESSPPTAIVVDGNGTVYVAYPARFAAASRSWWRGITSIGLAVDAQGNVYFIDSMDNSLREWIASGNQVITLAHASWAHPTGIAIDRQGNVLIADSADGTLKQYDAISRAVTIVLTGLIQPAL